LRENDLGTARPLRLHSPYTAQLWKADCSYKPSNSGTLARPVPQIVMLRSLLTCRPLWLLSVAALLVLVSSPAARADAIYTYSGSDFTVSKNPSLLPTGVVALSGSMTLAAPLGSNFSGNVTPTAFSFTDGTTTLTQLNAPLANDLFSFTTNSSGAIISWDVQLCMAAPGCPMPLIYFETVNTPRWGTDDAILYLAANGSSGEAYNSSSPGVWSDPTAAPEPSALLLLGSGLVGLIGAWRSKTLR
jgi:hypothetical protein